LLRDNSIIIFQERVSRAGQGIKVEAVAAEALADMLVLVPCVMVMK